MKKIIENTIILVSVVVYTTKSMYTSKKNRP